MIAKLLEVIHLSIWEGVERFQLQLAEMLNIHKLQGEEVIYKKAELIILE